MERRIGNRAQWIAASVFWFAVTGLYSAQLVWLAGRSGERIQIKSSLVWSGGFYLCWLPLTVVIWQLTAAWLPSSMGWPRFLLRHIPLAIVTAVAHSLLVMGFARLFLPPEREAFWAMLIEQLRGRSYIEAIIYSGVVASGQAVWFYDQWRARETQAARLEAQLATARLSTLQSQIHPHFLFNSLHAIASLARDGRNTEVVKMVADLSDLLRRVMEPEQTTLPLSTEVDLAQRYLDIQRVRFGDRLRVELQIDAAAAHVLVPALTLQPLVDNAVRHGVTTRVRGGTVTISATATPQTLSLRVADDGDGPGSGWTMNGTTGTGLANLRARLDILYGGRASMTAGPGDDGGFVVAVTVPR